MPKMKTNSAAKKRFDFTGKVQMIFQDPMASLNERAKVEYIIAEGLLNHHLYKDQEDLHEKVMNALHEVGLLPEFASRFPHEFSGGMLQRVMIGLALALKPSLIICDEPTTAIDSISQYAIMQEFLRIKTSRSAAMIFISHDLGVLSLISDKLVVMHRGLAVERGLPEEIFEHAKDPYTRELIDRHLSVMSTFSRAIRGEKVHAA